MANNIQELKGQLKELASVLNSFESEAVQLKMLEALIEQGNIFSADVQSTTKPTGKRKAGRPPKASTQVQETKKSPSPQKAKTPRTSRKEGPTVIIRKLLDSGFFKQPKSVKEIIEEADIRFGKKYKPTDISSILTNLIKSGDLNRNKNVKTKKFEYFKL